MRIYINIIVFLSIFPLQAISQSSYDAINKIDAFYQDKQYYTALNRCRDILTKCCEDPDDECWITNYMKEVYRFKGLCEYEIYKRELKIDRIRNAVESLRESYKLYEDPEVLYLYGYLTAYENIILKNYLDLDGLIDTWAGILELYGLNGWVVDHSLTSKIISFIKLCEHYNRKIPSQNYSGSFARFMIVSAYNLLDNSKLDTAQKAFLISIRKKYILTN